METDSFSTFEKRRKKIDEIEVFLIIFCLFAILVSRSFRFPFVRLVSLVKEGKLGREKRTFYDFHLTLKLLICSDYEAMTKKRSIGTLSSPQREFYYNLKTTQKKEEQEEHDKRYQAAAIQYVLIQHDVLYASVCVYECIHTHSPLAISIYQNNQDGFNCIASKKVSFFWLCVHFMGLKKVRRRRLPFNFLVLETEMKSLFFRCPFFCTHNLNN